MASKNYCVNKHFQFTPEQAKTLTEKAGNIVKSKGGLCHGF